MTATTKLTQSIKWHGGKHYLADRIVSVMPPRCKNPNAPAPDDPGWLHYVEPYFGGGSVLLAMDPEGISEVANDLSGELTNFWRVLQDQQQFQILKLWLDTTPFSESEFQIATGTDAIGPTTQAYSFFVGCRQSLAGRMQGFASITRSRTRRGMNEQVSAWLNAVEGLPAVHARLKRVLILNRDALDVIRQQDGPRTLFYLDPPYLHETRATNGEYGEHEMTRVQHLALLQTLGGIEGRLLLSGYHSDLYDKFAHDYGWKCHEFKIDNKAAGGKSKRQMVECVWTNY